MGVNLHIIIQYIIFITPYHSSETLKFWEVRITEQICDVFSTMQQSLTNETGPILNSKTSYWIKTKQNEKEKKNKPKKQNKKT